MVMVMSLGIAFTVTPWLAHRLSKPQTGAVAHASHADSRLHRGFNRLLLPFLADKKAARNRRWLWLGKWPRRFPVAPAKRRPADATGCPTRRAGPGRGRWGR